MNELLAIVGPTAVGKTKYSIELAKIFNGEIISGDSMQVYRKMNIGTAKVTLEEMQGIKHHLIDILNPDEAFNASIFKEIAENAYNQILARNHLPILAGGTGLYVNGFLYNYTFSKAQKNETYRKFLEKEKESKGLDVLFQQLIQINPEIKEKISPKDSLRIIRALEIYHQTKDKNLRKEEMIKNYQSEYNLTYIGLTMSREKLYDRINRRVDIMLDNGLVDEVKNLLLLDYSKELVSLQAIGYKEIILFLENQLSYENAVNLIKQKSRNFAKRQLTWFKRDPNIYWIDMTDKNENIILEELITYCQNKGIQR